MKLKSLATAATVCLFVLSGGGGYVGSLLWSELLL